MYTSMSDIGFQNKNFLIQKEVREVMTDQTKNWKIRTDTIDEIANVVSEKIQSDPDLVLSQSEQLIDFFVQLLSD